MCVCVCVCFAVCALVCARTRRPAPLPLLTHQHRAAHNYTTARKHAQPHTQHAQQPRRTRAVEDAAALDRERERVAHVGLEGVGGVALKGAALNGGLLLALDAPLLRGDVGDRQLGAKGVAVELGLPDCRCDVALGLV